MSSGSWHPASGGSGEPLSTRQRTAQHEASDDDLVNARRSRNEHPMVIIAACRDFVRGLARGVSFFLTERHDGEPAYTIPEAALARCLRPRANSLERRAE